MNPTSSHADKRNIFFAWDKNLKMSLNFNNEEYQNFSFNVKQEPEEEFLCILPSYETANVQELMHVKQENEIQSYKYAKFQCKICQKILTTNSILKTHKKTHQKQQCKVCNRKCSPKSFEKHMKSHQNEKSERKFKCKICFQKFWTNQQLYKHVKGHSKRFQCDLCENYSAAFKRDIMKHLNLHLVQGQYKCLFCRKLFEDQKSFRFHSRQIHGDPKNRIGLTKADLSCRTCGKKFDDVNARRSHEIFHGEKVQCKICDKKYKPGYLLKHIKMHELKKKEKRIECKICLKKFYTKSNLYCHMQTHNKNLKCDLCEYRAGKITELRQHMSKHTKLKLFKCENCSKVFKTAKNLNRHVIRNHRV